ncbi:MAG: DUF115 domain-containing protein [Magnetococcales bacterium]|nr:DUF115 domain-containing protein [Magnetococcales bacterium]
MQWILQWGRGMGHGGKDHLEANGALVRQRWPEVWRGLPGTTPLHGWEGPASTGVPLLEGRRLCSLNHRGQEARRQAATIPTEATLAWVYGLGCGELPRLLLKRKTLQQLTVVLTDAALSRLSLSCFDHRDWLKDGRVVLQTAAEHGEGLRQPFAVVPFDVQNALPGAEGESLRRRLQFELDAAILNQDHRRLPWLQAHITENAPFLQRDGDVGELAGRWRGQTVLVAAAGPTLSDHFGAIAAGRHPLLVVGAALKPLLAAGLLPDVVVSLDPAPITVQHFCTDLSRLQQTLLVYFPATPPRIVADWPGLRLQACSESLLYREYCTAKPSCTRLFSSGTVTHAVADLALLGGAGRICFLGADFAFPGGASHVAGTAHRQTAPTVGQESLLDGFGQPVATLPSLKSYLHDLEGLVKRHPEVEWFQASRRGAAISGCRFTEGSDLEALLTLPFQAVEQPAEQRLIQAREKARQGLWSEVEPLLGAVGDELPEIGLLRAMARLRTGAWQAALSLAQTMQERVSTDAVRRIRLLAIRGEALQYLQETAGSPPLLEMAMDLARAAGLGEEEAFVAASQARCLRHRGQLQPACQLWREAIELTGSETERAFLKVELADLLQQMVEVSGATLLLEEAIAVFDAAGLVYGAGLARHRLYLLRMAFPEGAPPPDPDCRRGLAQVVEALRQGRIATGNQALVGGIDCLLKAIRTGRLQPLPAALPDVMKAVVLAQVARDWVRVADLLEFELVGLLNGRGKRPVF